MQIIQPKSPILFIIFNRPQETAKVFEAIRAVKPSHLFIAADGPRIHKVGESELCETTRKITENIDWPCQIERLYRDTNLGCKIGVSTAINWFFEHVPEGIILEDDCLPNTSFFSFCDAMLEQYRNSDHVMAINGTNFLTQQELGDPTGSYHFSRCLHIWGWATWKRAWIKNDLAMRDVEMLGHLPFSSDLFLKKKYLDFWIKHFKHIRDKHIDTWDAQWHYSILKNNGIVISPHINMIENIGFGPRATHTTQNNPYTQPLQEIPDTILHPAQTTVDKITDARLMDKIYMRNLWQKIVSRIHS